MSLIATSLKLNVFRLAHSEALREGLCLNEPSALEALDDLANLVKLVNGSRCGLDSHTRPRWTPSGLTAVDL